MAPASRRSSRPGSQDAVRPRPNDREADLPCGGTAGPGEQRSRRSRISDAAFTTVTPPLVPLRYSVDDAWGPTPEAKAACHEILAALRNDGPFTPPSTQGTLSQPGNIGGAHWGGVAIDERHGLAVVPVNRVAAMVQLFVAHSFNYDSSKTVDAARGMTDFEYTNMRGTPYLMRRRIILGPTGCRVHRRRSARWSR